jgi:hypothetical protein
MRRESQTQCLLIDFARLFQYVALHPNSLPKVNYE